MAKSQSYDEFVDKFKPKLTTDDCYTPPIVYEAVLKWCILLWRQETNQRKNKD